MDNLGDNTELLLTDEKDILAGLLEAGRYKDDESSYRYVEIKRKGKLLFSFRIRPLCEDEVQECYKNATKYLKGRLGAPKTPIETDRARLRALLIYTATVAQDRQKIWNNRAAWDKFDVLTGEDLVERVLLAGEKDRICALIDEISGYDADLEERAKN